MDKLKREVVILKNKSNTLLLISNTSALLVDCGYDYEDTNIIIDYIKKRHLNLKVVIITHYHRDHIDGITELLKVFNGIKIYCTDETSVIYNNKWFESNFYLSVSRDRVCNIKKMKRLPTRMKFHDFMIKSIKLNGHCIGNVSLIIDNVLFSSDIVISNEHYLPFISDVDAYLDDIKELKKLRNIDKVVLTHSNNESITYTEFIKKICITEEENVLDNIINYLIKKNLIEFKCLDNKIYLERK